MTGKRKLRFEVRQYDRFGNWAVYDLLFDRWYMPIGKPILDGRKEEIEERCRNLQRHFELINPMPFLDASMTGPDYMDEEFIFRS